MTAAEIALAKGASDVFTFTYDRADVAQTFVFDKNDWGLSQGNGVDVSTTVRPTDETGGTWTASVTLFHLDLFSSAHVFWEGTGFTVEYTLNGTTWTAIAQHGVVALTGDPDFDIRVNFAGGVEADTAELTKLVINVLRTDTVYSTGSRSATFTADALDDGTILIKQGTLFVSTDPTSVPSNIGTLEFWLKIDQNSDETWGNIFEFNPFSTHGWIGFSNNNVSTFNYVEFGEGTLYHDGILIPNGTGWMDDGQWHHYVFVCDVASNTPFSMAGYIDNVTDLIDLSISHMALYPQRMTAAEAAAVYAAQNPVPVRVDDTANITVTEYSPATEIYAYAWSTISG